MSRDRKKTLSFLSRAIFWGGEGREGEGFPGYCVSLLPVRGSHVLLWSVSRPRTRALGLTGHPREPSLVSVFDHIGIS